MEKKEGEIASFFSCCVGVKQNKILLLFYVMKGCSYMIREEDRERERESNVIFV